MTEDRALEVIAAYGADSVRWPTDERAALLALGERPAVAAALVDAARLDALLGEWARAEVVAMPLDPARLRPAPAVILPTQRRWVLERRWIAAGALAAAVAAMVALAPMRTMMSAPAPQIALNSGLSPVPSATASSETDDDAGFAYVFTPTVDEDALI